MAPAREIISLDIDLRKVYAWSNMRGILLNGVPKFNLDLTRYPNPLLLLEIASPVAYREGRGPMYQTARWMIWNAAVCAEMDTLRRGILADLLVSPSSAWTLGYDHEARWKMAGIPRKGKKWAYNKDIRECIAMQWFHDKHPRAWTSLGAYMEAI
jgi:hypothetical protein